MNTDKQPVAPVEGDYTIMPTKLAEALNALVPIADAVCDHADAICRAFPIATFPNLSPKSKIVDVWDNEAKRWVTMNLRSKSQLDDDYTHWRETAPPPTTPPLPAVFTELGAALEKIKGAG